ncbi:MAG: dienelactone hydrolase family protein, partial [Acetobacteraceae bacterium]
MGSTIDLKSADGHALSAYTAGGKDATRALVVVQEIFGLNHHIRNVCDRFAAEGYVVCTPALFDRIATGIELGYEQDDMAKGRAWRMKLKEAGVLADIEAAAKQVAGRKTGIVGFCYGGTVTWWGATRSRSFAAASCW